MNILFFSQIQLFFLYESTNNPIEEKKVKIFADAAPITNDKGKVKKII
jgi:hypothetical protein